MDNYIERGSTY